MTTSRTDPVIDAFFDPVTGTVSYVVADPGTRAAALIDPVLDFDIKAARTSTRSADRLLEHVQTHGLNVQWILETHVHADHLSAARVLQRQVGGRIAIGAHIRQVQATFGRLYNLGPEFEPDGRAFDHLFADGEHFAIGTLQAQALHVPGHTPADMAYAVGATPDQAVFIGDTLFMPDVGSARADFPGGDARTLYRSVQRLLALPPATRLFVCHDYPPQGRTPAWQTTVAAQRAGNIHLHDGIGEDDFVAMRQARDATLDVPALILPALQVNVRAGDLPPAEANGTAYLKLPLNVMGRPG